jgi:hypothetical protein
VTVEDGHASGDGVVGKPQGARVDSRDDPAQREVAYGGTAMARGGGDDSSPVVVASGDG